MIAPQEENNPKKGTPQKIKKIKFKNPSEVLREYVELRTAFIKKHNLPWQIWEIA